MRKTERQTKLPFIPNWFEYCVPKVIFSMQYHTIHRAHFEIRRESGTQNTQIPMQIENAFPFRSGIHFAFQTHLAVGKTGPDTYLTINLNGEWEWEPNGSEISSGKERKWKAFCQIFHDDVKQRQFSHRLASFSRLINKQTYKCNRLSSRVELWTAKNVKGKKTFH